MRTKLIIASMMLVSVCFACKDQAPDVQDFSCDKTPAISAQRLGDIPMKFEYDEKGRLKKVFRTDGQGLIENYAYKADTILTITRNFADGSVGNLFNVILNDEGFIKKYTAVAAAPNGYTINYKYDQNGNLTETNSEYGDGTTYRTVYQYSEGNLATDIAYKNGKQTNTGKYLYWEDKENKADIGFNQNQPGLYGKISANLVKSIERNYLDGTKESYTFDYDINANGFVKSLSYDYVDTDGKGTKSKTVFEYVCL